MLKRRAVNNTITDETMNEKKFQAGINIFKNNNKITYLICIIIIIVVIIFGVPNDTASMTQQLGDENFAVVGADGNAVFVYYNDVISLEEREEIDRGTVENGIDTANVWSGSFINDEFGEYTLHAYVNIKEYIVVKYEAGVLVFNCRTVQDTNNMYKRLLEIS